jgi:hypothetical protein
MGLPWQQGPLALRSVGQFLVADPLPERLLFVQERGFTRAASTTCRRI